MKKLFLVLFAFATLHASAKDNKDEKYLAGAVPEVDGVITFSKTFSVPGKTQKEVNDVMNAFVNNLVEKSITAPGNYARMMESNPDSIVARACEWLVFKKKPLVLDRARFRYQIKVNTRGNRVSISLRNISYYYNEDMETNNGVVIKAEEWISDKEALNKSKTKLYPKSGKFRRKTVDRAEELFNAAMDAFEEPAPEMPVQKTHKSVVVE